MELVTNGTTPRVVEVKPLEVALTGTPGGYAIRPKDIGPKQL